MASFGERADAFLVWLLENGATVTDGVRVHDYSSIGMGTGVIATRDIRKGESLFKIPKRLLLSRRTSKHRPALKKVSGDGWERDMWAVVLEKRDPLSFWRPYFDMLPHAIITPRAWTIEERSPAAGSHLWSATCSTDDGYTNFLSCSQKVIEASGTTPTEEEYHYAGGLISAYSFTNADKIDLVPLADLLNHSSTKNNARLYHRGGYLEMLAHADMAKGEQVFNTFGDLSNTDLLLRYGFIEESNPNRYVVVDREAVERYTEAEAEAGLERLRHVGESWPDDCRMYARGDPEGLFKRLQRLGITERAFLRYRLRLYETRHKEPLGERQRLARRVAEEEKEVLLRRLKRWSPPSGQV